jgi:hypothetical protein
MSAVQETIRVQFEAFGNAIEFARTLGNELKNLVGQAGKKVSVNTKDAESGLGKFLNLLRTFSPAADQFAAKVETVGKPIKELVTHFLSVSAAGPPAAGAEAAVGAAGSGAAVGVGSLSIALGAVAAILAVIVGIIAAAGLIAYLVSLAQTAAEAGSKIFDLSQELAVSTETLSTLEFATRTTSTSFEDAAQSVSKFNKLIGEAADGSKTAARDLKRLGVEPKEALKDNEAALAKVFQRIHELPTPYEKARAAQIAFGKSGQQMVTVIESVNGNLEEAKEKAGAFGHLLSTEAAKQADEFGDRLDELKLLIEGFTLALGRSLIPQLLRLLRIFSDEASKSTGIFKLAIALVSFAVEKLTNDIIKLIAALKTLGDIATLPPALGVFLAPKLFAKHLAELNEVANTEPTGGGTTGENFEFDGSGGGKKNKPADTFESRLALERAGAQQTFDLEKDLLDRLKNIYKDAYDNRRIDSETFFENEERIRARQIENEIRFQKALIKLAEDRHAAELKKLEADPDKTPAQKEADRTNLENQFFAEAGTLSTRLLTLKRELEAIPGAVEAEATAATKTLNEEIDSVNTLLDELNGKTRTASDQLQKLIDAREKLITTGGRSETDPLVQAIDLAIEHLRTLDQIRNLDKQLEPLGQQFDIERLDIETKIENKELSRREGRRQLIELQRQYLKDQLEVLKNELTLTDDAKTQLEIKLRIAQAENDLAKLKEINETAREINSSLRNGLEDFFTSLASGTKNVKQAFTDLGLFILQLFARLAAQKLVEGLFGNLLGGQESQGGIGGLLSGIFGGAKAAGDMMSARPGGQIIQVAEAGFDELVVSTDPKYAQRTSGLLGEFIRRTGILPDFARFAAGGFARSVANTFTTIPQLAAGAFVEAGPQVALAGIGGAEMNVNEKHVHVWDPRHIHNEMASPAGQKVFWHFIDQNATLISRRLKR